MERSGLKKCDTIRTIRRNLKLKGPEPSMLTLVDFYLWNTNTHGCRRIAASRGPIKRTLWILLTMTAAAMIFWECVQLHLSYHTATMSVTMRHGKTEFPTVTICNLNPYKFNLSKHFLKDLDKMARCIVSRISSGRSAIFGENHVKACNMEFPVDPTPLVYLNMTLPANVKVMEILTGNDYLVNGSLLDLRSHSNQKIGMSDWWIALRLCDANVSNCIYNTFSSAISAMQEWYRLHFFNIMATVPEKDKIAMGYSADELIYACLYSGRTCDARDFTQFHHPHFGNCFVFNNDSSSKNLTALIPGNTHGLQLILHTEQQDYIPFLAGTAGTRIAIHSKYTKSFIEDVGINLQPATETLLGLSVSEIQKLGVPYSDCTEDGSDVPIENLYYSSYSLQICLQSCFQKEILQQCGCGHYERPLPAGYKYCNSQEFPGWEYCYYKLYSNYIAEELNCYRMCKQTCFQKEYTTKVSLAEWPSENTKDWLLKVLSIEQGLSRNLVLETSDVTRVNIYFNKLVVRSFVESPANTIVTLLSNCGGQLGLWMSCSVICIIEIIEIFAIDLPWILLKKMRRGWSRNATMTVTSPPQTVAPALEEAQFEPPTFQSALQCPSFPTTPSTPPPNYYSLSVRRELEFANDD